MCAGQSFRFQVHTAVGQHTALLCSKNNFMKIILSFNLVAVGGGFNLAKQDSYTIHIYCIMYILAGN